MFNKNRLNYHFVLSIEFFESHTYYAAVSILMKQIMNFLYITFLSSLNYNLMQGYPWQLK